MEKHEATDTDSTRAEVQESLESRVKALPEALGFAETDGLKRLKELIVGSLADLPDEVQQYVQLYRLVGDLLVTEQHGEACARARIGLLIDVGLVKRDVGMLDGCIDDLEDALVCAYDARYKDVAEILEDYLDSLPSREL